MKLWGFCHILSDAYFIFMPTAIFHFSKFFSPSFIHFGRLQSLNKILEALIYNPAFFISSQKTAISNLLKMSHEKPKTLKILTGPPVLNGHMHSCILVSAKTQKRKPNSASGAQDRLLIDLLDIPAWHQKVHRAFDSLLYTLPLLTWRLFEELSKGRR